MKHLFLAFLFLSFLLSGKLISQEVYTADSVETIPGFENFHRIGNIYISGQPDMRQIDWLKEQGVTRVINVRTPGENSKFKKKAFDPEEYFEAQGIEYHVIPLEVIKATFDDEKMDRSAQILDSGDKVLIQCKSGPRARYVLLRYLVSYKDYPVELAEEIVLKMGSYFPRKID
ncbi:hypothetical protein ACFLT1_03500 [Bacteroidota bacterium]